MCFGGKMKKVVIEVFILIIIAVVSSILIYNKYGNTKKVVLTEDEIKFKKEYEELNTRKDRNGIKYVDVKVPENNGIIYTNVKEIESLLNEGTGVIYIGTSELNYSRSVIEPLFNSKDSTGVETIYYLDLAGSRDEKSIQDGNVVVDNEGTNDYRKLLKLLDKYLPSYDGLDDNTIKRIYMPTIIFIIDGEISYVETIDNTEDEDKTLSAKEKNALASIFMKYMAEVSSGVCDEKC